MSTLKLDTIASRDGTESTDVTNVINGSAKAWVNFNGTGTVAIRESFNVSSITDVNVGRYTVNFTNSMQDDSYSISHGATISGGNGFFHWYSSKTTTSFYLGLINSTLAYADSSDVSAIVFR